MTDYRKRSTSDLRNARKASARCLSSRMRVVCQRESSKLGVRVKVQREQSLKETCHVERITNKLLS